MKNVFTVFSLDIKSCRHYCVICILLPDNLYVNVQNKLDLSYFQEQNMFHERFHDPLNTLARCF